MPRPKGPFQGKIDLFYRDEIVFLPSRRSDLHLLHDCFLEEPHARLRESVASLAAGSYACELVEMATESDDPNPKIYELLAAVLDALQPKNNAVLLIWFEIQLLAAAGWTPKWESEIGVNKVLRSVTKSTLQAVTRVRLSNSQIIAGQEIVWKLWDAQLGRKPRTRQFIENQITN